MRYSKLRLFSSMTTGAVAIVGLLFLISTAQVAMAFLPVVGIGGTFISADEFNGTDALAYPAKGQIGDTGEVTSTTACEERPMFVFDLAGAKAVNFSVYKDIKLPYFADQWMSIQIVETNGGELVGDNISLYITQMEASTLEFDNVRLAEGGTDPNVRSTDIWGPNSGHFTMQSDPLDQIPEGRNNVRTTGVKVWAHALTGQQIVMHGSNGGPVNIELAFVDSAQLMNRYDSIGMDTADIANRENYFDCLPGAP